MNVSNKISIMLAFLLVFGSATIVQAKNIHRMMVAETIVATEYLRSIETVERDERVTEAVDAIRALCDSSRISDKMIIVYVAELSTYVINNYRLTDAEMEIFYTFKRRLLVIS